MIVTFFVTLAMAGAIYYLYLPAYDALQVEEQSLNDNRATLQTIERNILPIDQQIQLINAFKQKVEIMQKTLPPIIYQEEVLRTISKILDDNGVSVIEYNFGIVDDRTETDTDKEAMDKILSGYEDTLLDNFSKSMVEARFDSGNESSEDESENKSWRSIVNTIDVGVSVEGEYENIKKAIVDLESLENIVIIEAMTIAKDSRYKNGVIGTVNILFPYYYDNETLERLNWIYESEFEDHLPFDYIIKGSLADPNRPIGASSNVGASNIFDISGLNDTNLNDLSGLYDREAEESKQLDSDFEVILSAPTSIMNKYFITKSNQRDYSLTSDRDSEELSITINESQGKYSFSYSTSFTSFPKAGEFLSFVPNYQDALYLTVVSSPRIDEQDVGMGRLNVYNKTTKPVKIFVNTDDEKLPRLVIGTQEGDISVIRN